MKLESVSIKRSEQLTEKWVQDQIADEPADIHAGDSYRRAMIPVFTRRALEGAAARA